MAIDFKGIFGGNDVIAHNFEMLSKRNQGERFYVDYAGKLQILTGCRKFWDAICNIFWPCCNYIGEKKAISRVFTELTPDRIAKLSAADNNFCKKFFFERMSRLSARVFNRADIREDVVNTVLLPMIQKERQATLELREKESGQKAEKVEKEEAGKEEKEVKSTAADAAGEAEQKGKTGAEVIKERHADYESRMVRVMLAEKLGMDFERASGGSSGVYIGTDLKGKKLLVFKPHDEGPFGVNNPNRSTRIRVWFERNICTCFQRQSLYTGKEYHAEAAASVVSEFITKKFSTFNITPCTKIEKFKSKLFVGSPVKFGSCKPWVDGMVPTSTHTPTVDLWWLGQGVCHYWNKDVPISDTEFQRFVILQFITGDQDGHADNWGIHEMEQTLPDGTKIKIKNIVAFDFGLSLPRDHPTSNRSLRKQYLWEYLNNAKKNFDDSSKKIIQFIHDHKIELFNHLRTVKLLPSQTEAMSEKELKEHGVSEFQLTAMDQRINALHAMQDRTPKELAALKMPDDFRPYLSKVPRDAPDAKAAAAAGGG